jgi:hypothetical protein
MKCENCGSKHDGSYGGGRFCGKICARSFSTKAKRKQINEKVSYTLTKNKAAWKTRVGKRRYCINCGNILKKGAQSYCSHECHFEYKYLLYINRWQLGLESGCRGKNDTSILIKRYLMWKHGGKCQKCGWNEINPATGQSPINLHHIDGNMKNNKEENLELLCPNCHSITPNYGSLNCGNSTRTFN